MIGKASTDCFCSNHKQNPNGKTCSLPAGCCMFKVKNRNTRSRFKICSKLTIKTPERRHGVFIVIFEHIPKLAGKFWLDYFSNFWKIFNFCDIIRFSKISRLKSIISITYAFIGRFLRFQSIQNQKSLVFKK